MTFAARDLSCGYHRKVIVHPQNFSLNPGDALALLGPNGSGKSTLLKTLTGLLTPVGGSVVLSGSSGAAEYAAKAKTPPPPWPRHVAFVPQEEAVSFPFSVRQVVMMGRLPHSPGFSDSREDHEIVNRAMARADCLAYADRPVTELSGGEKQRAYIARALAQLSGSDGPKVLLLDEPSTHLDFKHQAMLVRLIRDAREEGMIVVAAWHDLYLSASSCNQALLLVEGQTRYQGPTEELMSPDLLAAAFDAEFELSPGPRIRL